MGCGCKKKQETTKQTQVTPPTINISFVENTSSTLSESQEKVVNQIVDKLKQIGEESQ
jgi:hypothetical protein